jgi:hypothetical protein
MIPTIPRALVVKLAMATCSKVRRFQVSTYEKIAKPPGR